MLSKCFIGIYLFIEQLHCECVQKKYIEIKTDALLNQHLHHQQIQLKTENMQDLWVLRANSHHRINRVLSTQTIRFISSVAMILILLLPLATILTRAHEPLLSLTGTSDFKVLDEADDDAKMEIHGNSNRSALTGGHSYNASLGINHPIDSIQNIVNGVKVNGKYLTVATANMAHLDFVMNWRESIRRHLGADDKLLVVSLDDEVYACLRDRHIPTLHISELFDADTQDQNNLDKDSLRMEQQWGSATYNRLVNMKIDVAYILLKYYELEYLVYTDVDVVWLQPRMFEYFDILFQVQEQIQTFDILFSSSGKGPFYPCTGFYVIRKSDFSIRFLESISTFPNKQTEHDQAIATLLYTQLNSEDKLRIHALPGHLFMDGDTLAWREYYNVQPWIFHANYVVGFKGKKEMLEKAGYWYVDAEDKRSEYRKTYPRD